MISNACSKEIIYKQKGTDVTFYLGIGEHAHLHWTDTSRYVLLVVCISLSQTSTVVVSTTNQKGCILVLFLYNFSTYHSSFCSYYIFFFKTCDAGSFLFQFVIMKLDGSGLAAFYQIIWVIHNWKWETLFLALQAWFGLKCKMLTYQWEMKR